MRYDYNIGMASVGEHRLGASNKDGKLVISVVGGNDLVTISDKDGSLEIGVIHYEDRTKNR